MHFFDQDFQIFYLKKYSLIFGGTEKKVEQRFDVKKSDLSIYEGFSMFPAIPATLKSEQSMSPGGAIGFDKLGKK